MNTLEKKIIKVNRWLNKFEWGFRYNGKNIYEITNENYLDYRTLSIKDFVRFKIGTCVDYVNYEAAFFEEELNMFLTMSSLREDNTFSLYSMEMECKDSNETPGHVWLGFRLNGKIYAFESSWKTHAGIKRFLSEKDMIRQYISWQQENYRKQNIPLTDKVLILKYRPVGAGLTYEEFEKRMFAVGRIILER